MTWNSWPRRTTSRRLENAKGAVAKGLEVEPLNRELLRMKRTLK
jgi:hypothetical protein